MTVTDGGGLMGNETVPGGCGDPACPVLHADPANPIHPPDYRPETAVCVTCGGPLPRFPAFIHDGTRTPPVSGPYCDEHAVVTGTGSSYAPEEMQLEHLTTAKWEIVDCHRCTGCGHLTTNGHAMVEHLWTHVPFGCEAKTPASLSGVCPGCGWQGPSPRGPAVYLDPLHRDHLLHSARVYAARTQGSDRG